MRVRLTALGEARVAVDGAAADPPEVGKPFSLLLLSRGRLVVTGTVSLVGFDSFVTEEGDRYSWSREVGQS